jgi:ribosomal protein S18 acetylase RimI-like enzyme
MTIRAAIPDDAGGITRVFLDSSEYHARLDPERYIVPHADAITARYRNGQQHPPDSQAVTLVAELDGEIVGFVDARLSQSPDPMHRGLLFCHIVEIAVSSNHQSHGIGAQLLEAAENWGREHGAEFALLEYLAANIRAAEFYRRSGYGVASINVIKRL